MAVIVNAAAPRKRRATPRYISADDTMVYDHRSSIVHTGTVSSEAVADCEVGDGDICRGARDGQDLVGSCAINDRCAGVGTNEVQAFADAEILSVGRGSNEDRIAGRSERDSMSDGFTGSCGRGAVVAITTVHTIDIPRRARQSGWHRDDAQGRKQEADKHKSTFHIFSFPLCRTDHIRLQSSYKSVDLNAKAPSVLLVTATSSLP